MREERTRRQEVQSWGDTPTRDFTSPEIVELVSLN